MSTARPGRCAAALGLALWLAGCASIPPGSAQARDPWEGMNRSVFAFNEVVDEVAVKPVATLYQNWVPGAVRLGVYNVYSNVADAWTAANLALQLKPRQSLEMGMRVVVNSTLGLGGLLDWAEPVGLERASFEDFGQTLGYWGLKTGPYLVLPLLGPSNLRDAAALTLDYKASASSVLTHQTSTRNVLTALQVVYVRAGLLSASAFLDDIALDKYVLLRDAYLSRRRSLLYDGEPPDDEASTTPPFKSVPK
jgi:phospholipid-binding lipoprotein MlaA